MSLASALPLLVVLSGCAQELAFSLPDGGGARGLPSLEAAVGDSPVGALDVRANLDGGDLHDGAAGWASAGESNSASTAEAGRGALADRQSTRPAPAACQARWLAPAPARPTAAPGPSSWIPKARLRTMVMAHRGVLMERAMRSYVAPTSMKTATQWWTSFTAWGSRAQARVPRGPCMPATRAQIRWSAMRQGVGVVPTSAVATASPRARKSAIRAPPVRSLVSAAPWIAAGRCLFVALASARRPRSCAPASRGATHAWVRVSRSWVGVSLGAPRSRWS